MLLKVTWGQGEIISPCGMQGRSPCFWRAFNEADLRSKSAQRALICAPQGHALGGRSPTFNSEDYDELVERRTDKTHWEAVRIGA